MHNVAVAFARSKNVVIVPSAEAFGLIGQPAKKALQVGAFSLVTFSTGIFYTILLSHI